MNKTQRDLIVEIFSDPSNLTPERLREVAGELFNACKDLKDKVLSKDEKEKEEGLREALELKAILEKTMDGLSEKMGLDPSQMVALAKEKSANPAYSEFNEDVEKLKELFTDTKSSEQKQTFVG